MKNAFLLFLMLFGYCISMAQSFEVFLNMLASAEKSQKGKMMDEFLSGRKVPLIEGKSQVHFFYKGPADSVAIAGDATAWSPSLRLKKIEGTNYWYGSATYEPATRLEYKVVVNGTKWMLDPLNPVTIAGGMGDNSELTLPDYQPPLYTWERDVVPYGTCADSSFSSRYLKEKRAFRIYTPSGYEKGDQVYDVAYFHDGNDFVNFTAIKNILDNMIYEHKMKPIIAVFIEPVHRDEEYSGKRQKYYTRFIVKELIPYMDTHYRTLKGSEHVAQFGISNGGNIALWLAITQSSSVGKVAAFSSNVQPEIISKLRKSGCGNVQYYVDLGKFDIPFLVPLVGKLVSTLKEKGCELNYHEYPEGHNWKFWEKHLPDALEYFFPFK